MSQPVYHYLDIGRLGRGEVVRLFMRDAGIQFQDIRYAFDDTWQTTSKSLKEKGISPTGKLPVLEYEGKFLSQHVPILRYLSREIGSYDGKSSYEKYIVDAVSDLYIDWRASPPFALRSQWVPALKKVTEQYKDVFVPNYYNLLSRYYSENGGPFLLGKEITYADFAVYCSIDNDDRIGTLPPLPESLVKFRDAFEKRPRIAEYIIAGRNSKA